VKQHLAPYHVLNHQDLDIKADPPFGLRLKDIGVEYFPMVGDAKISFTFHIKEKGRYQINAVIDHSVFGSPYQSFLNGQPLGQMLGLCAAGSDLVWTRFDLHNLDAGAHTLSFEGRGPSQ